MDSNICEIELIKDSVSGNSCWFHGMVGHKFKVKKDKYYGYYVIENNIITHKTIPKSCCNIV